MFGTLKRRPRNIENDVVMEQENSSWVNKLSKGAVVEHDTDDETASITSDGTFLSILSKSSSKINSKGNKDHKNKKNFSEESKQDDEETQIERTKSLNKRFGIDSEELVEREKRSDRQYSRRRSMDLIAPFHHQEATPEYLKVHYDWDMPLFHEPPPNKELLTLKGCIATEKNTGISQKSVNWPSCFEALCHVTIVVTYDESMIDSCFYNNEDFNKFRLDKFVEDHSDEYQWVTEEEELEEGGIIEEEIVYEYYEEEVVEELPIERSSMSRRTSL